jgi:hypothetical protein
MAAPARASIPFQRTMSKFERLAKEAQSYGWKLERPRVAVRYGRMMIRYFLVDKHGTMYFRALNEVEHKLRQHRTASRLKSV